MTTKRHIPHLFLQFESQDNVLLLPIHNQKSPYQVFWCTKVNFRRLRIRVVSQCVVCVYSDVLGSDLFVRVCLFTDSSGSLYIHFFVRII